MNRPELSDTAVRRCGLAAVVLALASIPLAPLNALARMQTASGRALLIEHGIDPDDPLSSIVPRFVRDPLYRWIARNRYRMFGRRAACRVPTPDIADRFLH